MLFYAQKAANKLLCNCCKGFPFLVRINLIKLLSKSDYDYLPPTHGAHGHGRVVGPDHGGTVLEDHFSRPNVSLGDHESSHCVWLADVVENIRIMVRRRGLIISKQLHNSLFYHNSVFSVKQERMLTADLKSNWTWHWNLTNISIRHRWYLPGINIFNSTNAVSLSNYILSV